MDSFVFILCWLGVFQSLLIAFYFLSAGRQSINQVLLGLTMLMVALRAAKSTLYLFQPEVNTLIINLGFAAHAAIGPLLFLYTRSLNNSFKWSNYQFLHFIPTVLIIGFSSFLDLNSFWYEGGYDILLYLTLIYTVFYIYYYSFLLYNSKPYRIDGNRWILILLVALTIFQFSYFSNYILGLTSYSTGPILYSVAIYMITFVVIRNNRAIKEERREKYSNVRQTSEDIIRNLQLLEGLMTSKKPYRDCDFSLQRLSDLSGLPSYLLSHTFSQSRFSSFTHFTNTYRIREAEAMLGKEENNKLTIAGIAYECGFNSLSSFNAAFKKVNGSTPSVYKKLRQQTLSL